MTKIKLYIANPLSNDSEAAKGSVSNPYTEAEYESMINNDKWSGNYKGHIAMFSGDKWISDFVQRDMWGGDAYRNKAEYTLFRR